MDMYEEKNSEKELDDQFEEVYENLTMKNAKALQEIRAGITRFIVVAMVGIIALIIFFFLFVEEKFVLSLGACFAVCVLLILIITGKQMYRGKYKNLVISELVKGYCETLDFEPKKGLSHLEFKEARFDTSYDEYNSEDLIYGQLQDGHSVTMSEVSTMIVQRTKNSDGTYHEERTETFRGLVGHVKLNNRVPSDINVLCDSRLKKFSKDRVELESSEFEKYFDCLSKDRVLALRVFTVDLVEKIVEFRKRSNGKFIEFKIMGDTLFFRYNCGQMFEPPTLKTGLDKEFVKKYYGFIFYPLELLKDIIENVENL